MLLSRVAETVYWAGRYLERAESTARIVAGHTELYLDLPKAAGLTWAPLLALTGSFDEFDEGYVDRSEEHVIAFLLADPSNGGGLLSSLAMARENMRTTRSVFPREAFEALNSLHHRVTADCHSAIARRDRLAWLQGVVGDCQRLTGLLAGAMSQDEAYNFFRTGRHIERADMTTRVLDVRAGTLVARAPAISPYADVLWMSVLTSVGGAHAYRRQVSARVRGAEVLRFLLQDPAFPRSVDHSLSVVAANAVELPAPEAVLGACARARHLVHEARVKALAWDGLHDYVDDLQQAVHEIDDELRASYFRPERREVHQVRESQSQSQSAGAPARSPRPSFVSA